MPQIRAKEYILKATEKEISHLLELYAKRDVYHGELHDHAATGGTSDGKKPLMHWRGAMEALSMDFAAILDHRQVRHMYLPEWEDGTFICGTEPGTFITDSGSENGEMHYNMLVPNPKELEALLLEFPEYCFTEGSEGHFIYPKFTTERFCELINALLSHGGFFVYPHPKQLMKSENPLDYWFVDNTGLEVFYEDMRSEHTKNNYKLWCDLLALGKKVYATAGCDKHKCCQDTALTTIYASEKSSRGFLQYLREGDFVCGSVGIRMAIGDARMGYTTDFDGKKLTVLISDFHKSVRNPEHEFRMDVITDKGVVFSSKIDPVEMQAFTLDAESDAAFYRVEIFDENQDLRITIGNPIWNERMSG